MCLLNICGWISGHYVIFGFVFCSFHHSIFPYLNQGQGMTSFIHLAKNVNAAELGVYEDVILDTCCQNIASSDEIWHLVVEMSVLVVTCTQWSNPRSIW